LRSAISSDTPSTFEVHDEGIRLRVRPLNSHDLAAILDCPDLPTAQRLLAARCIVDVLHGDAPADMADVPEQTLERVSASLEAADPDSERRIDLRCTECAEHWMVDLDIALFLWSEIQSLTRGLMHEVHELAWAYGWAEHDILAMSDARRKHYLDLVR
jgi:hypothetical protein